MMIHGVRPGSKSWTGFSEAGLYRDHMVLVGGDPGIGKSTLLLQVCQRMAQMKKILYISGEESQAQIKLRANRMGNFTSGLLLLCETNLGIIRSVIEKERPEHVVIDSIQTMYSEDVTSGTGKCFPGGGSQPMFLCSWRKDCAFQFLLSDM